MLIISATFNQKYSTVNLAFILKLRVPLKLEGFSGGSVQVSVKPQTAANPAAVLTMHRY